MDSYFNKRNELREKAKKHNESMEASYKQEINVCAMRTLTYGGETGRKEVGVPKREAPMDMNIVVDDMDTVQSLFAHHEGKTAVLNFASYKNPGGMFLNGSSAQEECLCHSSFLYNVLSRHPEYYAWNKTHLNRSLYSNRALYSENVIFIQPQNDEKNTVIALGADVITCAAPNFKAAYTYASMTTEENESTLYSRIKFILNIAEENNVETLILGGFGCGVFGQDATKVAQFFKKCLETYNYKFKNVYFSIINRENKSNYEKFKAVFDGEK